MIDQMQQGMGINLRNDLFSHLSGEITLEVEKAQPDPVWKAILSVNDPEKLQHALSRLLDMAPVKSKQVEEDGVTYRFIYVDQKGFQQHPPATAAWLD